MTIADQITVAIFAASPFILILALSAIFKTVEIIADWQERTGR